jgi:eukaryotic-like serine/threonine-protein kinase
MSDQGTRREAGGTRREDGGAGGTRHEVGGAGGTRHEAGGDTPRYVPVVSLPARLAERFRVTNEMLMQGAEATVLVVEDLQHHEERVLKLYRPGIDLDGDAVGRLIELSGSDEGRRHIVQLYEACPDDESGLWYEVQEFCRHRSLRDVMRAGPLDAAALATELGEALAYLEGRLYLRDLKPENLLVRALDPFDVVVADFGLARSAQAGSVRWTEGGTAAYMPPEAGVNRVTKAWDWWSAGMLLAEVALGHHPLVDESGHLPPSLQILDLINRTPVDLSGIADERIRLLCRGLLVRDAERRWRADQVRGWLAGDEPEVPADDGVGVTATATLAALTEAVTGMIPAAPPAPTSTIRFGGTAYDDPDRLAAAFQDRWDYAMSRLFQDRDAAWIAELDTFLRDHDRPDAAQIVAKGVLGATDLPQRMASLLVELSPHLDPVYDGLRVTPAGLAEAAHAVVSGRQPGLKDQLRQVRFAGVLTLWTSLPGMRQGTLTADKIDETWQQSCRELERLAAGLRTDKAPDAEVLEVAKARLLLCALDEKQHSRLQRSVRHKRSREGEVPWWRVLADQARTSIAAAALAEILAPEARYVAESERRRRAEADATARGTNPARDRGVLTARARAPGRRPVLLAAVPALLVGGLLLVDRFQVRIGFFMVATSDPGESSYPFAPEDLDRLLAAGPWIVAAAIGCAAAQVVGAWTGSRRLRSATARLYVGASALAQGLAGAALAAVGVAVTMLGYVAVAYEDEGLPPDYVPDTCRAAIAAALAVIGGVYLFYVSLRRLALALFGGQVIVR